MLDRRLTDAVHRSVEIFKEPKWFGEGITFPSMRYGSGYQARMFSFQSAVGACHARQDIESRRLHDPTLP